MTEKSHTQYGNNFCLLFDALKGKNEPSKAHLVRIYLERAEDYPGWNKFLSENQILIQHINVALSLVDMYRDLLSDFADLLKKQQWDEADAFAEAESIEPIGIVVWNIMNPLLEEAGSKMDAIGLDQRQFWK